MKPKLAGTALMIGGIAAFALLNARVRSESRDWPVYGGGLESIRYSALKQINRTNVHRLEISWTYDAGDGPGGLETSPIIVNGILYANTPKTRCSHWMRRVGNSAGRSTPGSRAGDRIEA